MELIDDQIKELEENYNQIIAKKSEALRQEMIAENEELQHELEAWEPGMQRVHSERIPKPPFTMM